MPNERFMRHHYGPSGLVRPTVGPPPLPDPTQGALTRQDIIDTGAWFRDENRMNIGGDVQWKALALVGDNLRLRDELDHETASAKDYAKKYHEAMNILSAWKNIDHAEAIAQLLDLKEAQKDERASMFKDIQRIEAERDSYKKAWERRGKALALPCLQCGHVQNTITTKEE